MKQNIKILISGEKGFVGSHLSNYLVSRGFRVVGLGNTGNNLRSYVDVTDLSQLLRIRDEIGTVIHLAAKTSINDSFRCPFDTYFTNIVGTLNLLEYARQKRVAKFIYLSTYTYGDAQYHPVDENHPVNPHSPYNKSKLVAEQLCEYYSHDFGLNAVALRTFYLYGPCPKPNSFLHCIIEQIMKNKGKVVLSGKLTKRDFLFIDDFCRLVENILIKFPNGYNLYNIGSGSNYTLKQVTEILGKLLNKKISIRYDRKIRTSDVIDMVADITKASNEFNWRPHVSLEHGLQQVVDHYLMK